MKLSYLVIFSFQLMLSIQEDEGQLYPLPGSDTLGEFNSQISRQEVLNDIKQFDQLPQYKKKRLYELDPNDKKGAIEITRQLYNQAQNKGASEFFQPPEDLYESGEISDNFNLESLYDPETDQYLHKFKSQAVLQSMKRIHEHYFQQQQENQKSPLSFIQQSEQELLPRPKELPNDFKNSFMSIENTNKMYPLKHHWQYLAAKNCWASSRYEYSYMWQIYFWLPVIRRKWGIPYIWFARYKKKIVKTVFSGYPCSTHTTRRQWWYWYSERIPYSHQQQEIVFRLEFDEISRLKLLQVTFLTIPREIRLESTQDKLNWEVVRDWQESPDWSYRWWNYKTNFDPMIFTRSIKIVMRGWRRGYYGNRHGIWRIQAYSQQQTVQVMYKDTQEIPQCLARAEGSFNQNNRPFIMMNCYDAILQNDAREIFFLDQLNIKQWSDRACIAPQPAVGSEPQFIVSQKCKNDEFQEWVLDRLGRIQNNKFKELCLASKENNAVSRFESYGIVSVSNTISDTRAKPYSVIDPNGYGWWAPTLDEAHATFQVLFERSYSLQKLIIQWKLKPPKMEIQLLTAQGSWKTMLNETPADDVEMVIPPMEIKGVKIQLMDMVPLRARGESAENIYGIQKLQLFRPGTPVSLEACAFQGDDSKIKNRFKIEEVEYINTAYKVPYETAEKYMESQYSASLVNIRYFLQNISQFYKIITLSQKFNQVIGQMVGQIQNISKELQQLSVDLKNQEKQEDEEASDIYASSSEAPAGDCQKIKEYAEYKRNGYYWIKTKCMPKAERVYCDMDNNFPNFYLYVGNKNDQNVVLPNANTAQGIKEQCGAYGLEPVNISTGKQMANIIAYLDEIKASSGDDIGIPFGYKWSKDFISKYKSFNSPSSIDLDEILKSFINKSIVKNLVGQTNDALVMVNSKDKLTQVSLLETKIRVCSQNTQLQGKSKNTLNADCLSTLDTLMPSSTIGQIQYIQCPKGCTQVSQGRVAREQSRGIYSSYSSICRAALFEGIGKEQESSIFSVVVKNGERFQPQQGDNNGIVLDTKVEMQNKSFKFNLKPIEQECPNLANNKKSFISFEEIMNKIQHKKNSSFIESGEENNLTDFQELKNRLKHKTQIKSKHTSKEEDDDDSDNAEDGGTKDQATSAKAIIHIKNALKQKLQITENYQTYVDHSKQIIQAQRQRMLNLNQSNQNPQKQAKVISSMESSLSQLEKESQRIMARASSLIDTNQEDINLEIGRMLNNKRYEGFTEEFKFMKKIDLLYQILNNNNLKDEPKWEYVSDNIQPHTYALAQKVPSTCNDDLMAPNTSCTATQLELKYKIMYDSKVTFSFKTLDISKGYIGIIFRRKDDFNYYALDINKKWVRIRKMQKGKPSIINSVAQNQEIYSNKWYNVELIIKQNVFLVKLAQESDDGKNQINDAPLLMRAEDLYFYSGSFALITDNARDTFFTDYNIEPITCFQDPFNPEKAVKYILPTNRKKVNFEDDIDVQFKQPENAQNPWTFKNNYFSKKTVHFLQKVLFAKEQTDKKTAPIELKDTKFDKGTLSLKFLAENDKSKMVVNLFEKTNSKVKAVISPERVTVIEQVGQEKHVLMDKKYEKNLKYGTWNQFYINSDETKMNVLKQDENTNEVVPLAPQGIEKTSNMQSGPVKIKLLSGSIGISDLKVEPKNIDELLKDKEKDDIEEAQQIKEKAEKEDDNDDDDQEQETKKDTNYTEFIPESHRTNYSVTKRTYKEAKIDHSKCLLNRSPEDRLQYCQQKYPSEEQAQKCSKNFCSYCCGNKYPTTMKYENELCQEDCKKQAVPSDSVDFTQCVEPTDSNFAYGNFCSLQYATDEQNYSRKLCQIDLCKSCCVSLPLMNDMNISDKSIIQCQENCKNKFDKD